MDAPSRGFTIVEVLAALLLLGIGAIAVAGGAGAAERMLGRGRRSARAAILAGARLDQLRRAATASTLLCSDAAFSGGTADAGPERETWTVAPAGPTRMVRDVVEYSGRAGTVADTMSTIVGCAR